MDNPIRKAAGNVKGRWHQGSYDDGRGSFCGLGHLAMVVNTKNDPFYSEEFARLRVFMDNVALEQYPERVIPKMEIVGSEYPNFAWFNDHPDTTEDDVISVMEKAAVRYEEEI